MEVLRNKSGNKSQFQLEIGKKIDKTAGAKVLGQFGTFSVNFLSALRDFGSYHP